jgi:hypothetical protein
MGFIHLNESIGHCILNRAKFRESAFDRVKRRGWEILALEFCGADMDPVDFGFSFVAFL